MNELSLASQPEIIEPIVSARGLRKKFGRKEILHGLDFDIPPGRIYGLIGHNGAGKTTTLNAMLGLTNCEGTIRVPYVMSLVAGAPNAEAGKKALDFILSDEGQAIWTNAYLKPARPVALPAEVATPEVAVEADDTITH